MAPSLARAAVASLAIAGISCARDDHAARVSPVHPERAFVVSETDEVAETVNEPELALQPARLHPMARISGGVPAHASETFPGSSPSLANDDDYRGGWRSAVVPWPASPVWLAYDLSSVPEAHRRRVVVHWYHDHGFAHYDSTAIPELAYHLPRDYQLQVNAAPGGGSPPPDDDPGWTTVTTVTGNALLSRQHVVPLDEGGVLHPWIRLRCTAPFGTMYKQQLAIGMDVFDAGEGLDDDWIFFGDSITAMTINQLEDDCKAPCPFGQGTLGQRIHAERPAYFPLVQGAGIGGATTTDGVRMIAKFLPQFPGRFVALAFGTNDAPPCELDLAVCTERFFTNMESMVNSVLAAGKIPVVPTIPWARHHTYRAWIPALNQRVAELYAKHPEIVRGPDSWTLFEQNPSLLSRDALHPSVRGFVALRQAWATVMLTQY